MTQRRWPELPIIFTALPELVEHAGEFGVVLVMPVEPAALVQIVLKGAGPARGAASWGKYRVMTRPKP